MDEGRQYKYIAMASSYPQTLEYADALLAQSRVPAANHPPLPACAVVMTAAALAQAIHARLRSHAHLDAAENNIPVEDTVAWKLSSWGQSFRRKLMKLPDVVSYGRFEIDPNASDTRVLQDLIVLRNRLMHINEEPIVGEATEQELFDLQISIDRKDEFTWGQVQISHALSYRAAVQCYLDQIIERHGADIVAGSLLRKVG